MGKDKLPQKSSRSEVDAFLRKVAATPAAVKSGESGRLVFAMDATASRKPTWDHACHLQAQMFEATDSLGGLAIQQVLAETVKQHNAKAAMTVMMDVRTVRLPSASPVTV